MRQWIHAEFVGARNINATDDLREMIAALQEAIDAGEDSDWRNLHVIIEDNDDLSPSLAIHGERLETDDELSDRDSKETTERANRYRLYKQLKREFAPSMEMVTTTETAFLEILANYRGWQRTIGVDNMVRFVLPNDCVIAECAIGPDGEERAPYRIIDDLRTTL